MDNYRILITSGVSLASKPRIGHDFPEAIIGVNPQDLRAWLLLFDYIVLPFFEGNKHILGNDIEFLIQEGILGHRKLTIQNDDGTPEELSSSHPFFPAALAAECVYKEFQEYDNAVCAIASGQSLGEHDGFRPKEDIYPPRGFYIELMNTIPVPDRVVPLEDILRFREHRQDELMQLRHHIEDIYQEVISASDQLLARTTAVERFENAIVEQLKVSSESGLKFRMLNFAGSFNVVPAIGAFTASLALGITEAAAIGAAVGSSLNIGPSIGWSKASKSSNPFSYVFSYHKELF
jgi:hypothetical protein